MWLDIQAAEEANSPATRVKQTEARSRNLLKTWASSHSKQPPSWTSLAHARPHNVYICLVTVCGVDNTTVRVIKKCTATHQ